MIEGYVNYCEYSDTWIIVKSNGEIQKINNLVYGVAPYFKEWDDVYGDGEYVKFSFSIG